VLYNASHGIELQGSYYVVEDNEVAYNGFGDIGTSGIHVFSSSPAEDAGDHNVIRNNVTYRAYQLLNPQGVPGPDGNGIELDNWCTDNDVYGNVSFQNGGTGMVAFRAARARIFGNVLFDNMKSPAHANFARPTELFVGSLSQNPEDQVSGYVVKGNVVVSGGEFSGSSHANITSIFVDAPTIFESRWIGQNRYLNAAGGDFFLWGWDDSALWGGGEFGASIARWNELKQNGDPDVYGGVALAYGSGTVSGSPAIDLMVGSTGQDALSGGSGDDVLVGDAGDDTLDGGSGADRLIGGFGNDTYVVDDPGDRISEFPDAGNDNIVASVSEFLPRNLENLTLSGADAINGVGNETSNELRGNDSNNVLIGNGGDDYLQGNGGADYLAGGEGGDYLDGGVGNDVLDGGPGDDLLVGREGEDVFVVARGQGADVVFDFEGNLRLGGDYLVLQGFGPGATLAYTGAGGVWRIDFTSDGVPSSQIFVMLGVTVLGSIDYEFR
jgi:Ca2+-binding RTX toxin-like protein